MSGGGLVYPMLFLAWHNSHRIVSFCCHVNQVAKASKATVSITGIFVTKLNKTECFVLHTETIFSLA